MEKDAQACVAACGAAHVKALDARSTCDTGCGKSWDATGAKKRAK
jgi:hypothetical protein